VGVYFVRQGLTAEEMRMKAGRPEKNGLEIGEIFLPKGNFEESVYHE
jgi:hypothetical protein